jgi:hypothetical protein
MRIKLSDGLEHHCCETSNCPHKFEDCKCEKWRDIADELCPLCCAPRFIYVAGHLQAAKQCDSARDLQLLIPRVGWPPVADLFCATRIETCTFSW